MSIKIFFFLLNRNININRPIFIRVHVLWYAMFSNGWVDIETVLVSKNRSYPSPHVNVGHVYQRQTVAQNLRCVVDVDLIYKNKDKTIKKVYQHNYYDILVFVTNAYFWAFLCTICMCIRLIVKWATVTKCNGTYLIL